MIAWQKEPAGGPWHGPARHEVFQIDTRMRVRRDHRGLPDPGRPAVPGETGTAPSAPSSATPGGPRDSPGDLATVVVTHIHLDHAGGPATVAEMFPAAQIVVHQRGARTG